MKKWIWLSLVIALVLSAPTYGQTTMTTAQKVRLAVTATLDGTHVPLPTGTLLVWSVEGDSASNRLGTFEGTSTDPMAVYYLPAKAGTHVLRVSLVAGEKVLGATATVTVTVTDAIPNTLTIAVGTPVNR